MAGFGDLLQRITRSLEEARVQQPGDDLRTRLGYGTGDDDDGSEWDAERGREAEPESGAARTRPIHREPETVWSPGGARAPARAPARTTAQSEASETVRAQPIDHYSEHRSGRRPHSPATPHHSPAMAASLLSERIRARLGTPDALREAFVVKEILDRPLGRRHRR